MSPEEIESLERATVEAVAPASIIEMDGWLIAFDPGTIRRAHSAVPLRHDLDASALDAVEAAYRTAGLPPAFRLPLSAGLEGVRNVLVRRGYTSEQPTVVEISDVVRLAAFRDLPGEILAHPDDAWGEVFLGPGFDPVDGAERVAVLTRSPDALYGQVREGGRTVAVGVVTFGHGWAGVHGMRTASAHQGRGHASQILAALGRAARERGFERVFLQVEEANSARRIYRRAGFKPVWTYRYWTKGTG